MTWKAANHPFVIWAVCYLWLISLFEMGWSLMLFFFVADLLLLTGTDLVNAFVLLSGLMMLPTNIHLLCVISRNKKVNYKDRVIYCPVWLCITWIIVINTIGAILCLQRIYSCQEVTFHSFFKGMNNYKDTSKYRRFVDDIQWSLRCCGLQSYKDWFNHDWYDGRDFDMDSADGHGNRHTDSVPLSCCKTGVCMTNYLQELGPTSINTAGCGQLLYRIVVISMAAHAVMFLTVIVVELILLNFLVSVKCDPEEEEEPEEAGEDVPQQSSTDESNAKNAKPATNVRRIMSVNDRFDISSGSFQAESEDSDVNFDLSPTSKINMDVYK